MDPIRRTLIASLALTGSVFATGDFYEDAIPTLNTILGQLPAKSVGDILGTKPAGADAKINFQTAIAALAKLPAAQALAEVDKLLPAARAAQPRTGPGITNFLHDLRDLFTAATATPREIEDYVKWRSEHTEWFGFAWGNGRTEDARQSPSPEEMAALEKLAAAASPALKPHWLYLCGAVSFKSGNDTVSEKWFLKVVAEFPAHPRAESARFMVARCRLSQSRVIDPNAADTPGYNYASQPAGRAAAVAAFNDYLTAHPQGRFVGDVTGWLGAAAYDAEDYVGAMQHYLRQAQLPDHPELAASASQMAEKTLSRIASAPDDARFAALAKTPSAMLGLVYLILNSTESDNFNGELDEPDVVSKWRLGVLPRVARAIAANEALYKDAEWKPRYLAMLALAASGAGNQAEAIRLLELGGDAKGDDMLFARGVVMQRAKRPQESVAASAELLKSHPNSALAKETGFRLAFALFDAHRSGEALVHLLNTSPPAEEYNRSEVLTRLDAGHYQQLADALLNFAPIPELIAGADTPGLDPALRLQITGVIAQRLLAKEQFEEARKFVPPAQWSLFAEKLAALTSAAKGAQAPAEKAAACLALGDAWAAARGKVLTIPLDAGKQRRDLFRDDHARADERRAANAQALGAAGNYKLDLELRDELRHAFNWWIEASDAQPKTPLAAQALWRALRAMPLIADVSPFHYERAVSRKWSDVSRKLYERLKKEHPASEEARKLAVFWTFAPPPKRDPDEWEGAGAGYDTPRGAKGDGAESWEGFASMDDAENGRKDPAVGAEIAGIVHRAGDPDAVALKKTADALQKRAHASLTDLRSSPLVNYIDDLALFFAEPDASPAARKRYVQLRYETLKLSTPGPDIGKDPLEAAAFTDEELRAEIAKALADPAMRAVADYLAYLDGAVVANHMRAIPFPGVDKDGEKYTYSSRNWTELESLMRAFLEKYPKSRKREAALLMHAKALALGMRPKVFDRGAEWPLAPRWEGGPDPVTHEQIPFDAARLKGALDRYDKEFPRGRYAKEIRDYRAGLAMRMGDWTRALQITVAELADAAKPSLQEGASDRLKELFNKLPDEKVRPELLAAIKADPRARGHLADFIKGGAGNAMFSYLSPWLGEQMKAR